MKNIRLGLLLAAATIVAIPAIAQAQEQGDRHGRGDGGRPVGVGRGEGQRNDQNGDGRQRGPRPDAPAPVAQQAPQSAPVQQQARAAEYARRQGQQRQQGQGGNGNWSRQDNGGRRDFNRAVPSLQGQPASPQRFDGNRGFGASDNRGGYNRGGDNRGGDNRANDNRANDNRGYDNRGGDHHRYVEVGRDNRGYDNRGNWQRGWRNDGRYDWQGWRTRNRGLFHIPRYAPPRGYGYGYRLFSPGYRLDPFFYSQNYWLADPWDYRLPPAYGPYRWVRYYNDVLLVDITRGVVVDVIRDFFW
jgi:hypothetical protein